MFVIHNFFPQDVSLNKSNNVIQRQGQLISFSRMEIEKLIEETYLVSVVK